MDSGFFNNSSKGAWDADFKALDELTSLAFKPILTIKDMIPNNPLKILSAKKVKTQYGERLVLELEKYQMYLPPRFVNISEATFNRINEGDFCITNNGGNGKYANLTFTNGDPSYLSS